MTPEELRAERVSQGKPPTLDREALVGILRIIRPAPKEPVKK